MHRCSTFEVLLSTLYTADRVYEVGHCSIAYMVENHSYVFAAKLLHSIYEFSGLVLPKVNH